MSKGKKRFYDHSKVLELIDKGLSGSQISKMTGMAQSTISNIKKQHNEAENKDSRKSDRKINPFIFENKSHPGLEK